MQKPSIEDDPIPVSDADGDGYDAEEDCDDQDPDSYPSAEEICDEVDNNCDGVVDEGVQETFTSTRMETVLGHKTTLKRPALPPKALSQMARTVTTTMRRSIRVRLKPVMALTTTATPTSMKA